MCEVDIYHDDKTGGTILKQGVSKYDLDLKAKTLTAHSHLGETEEFEFSTITGLKWEENDDSLVIEGDLALDE